MADLRKLKFILKGTPTTDDLNGSNARIELRVGEKQVNGVNKGGVVDNIRLSLKKAKGDKIDVLYDDLMKTENLNKEFTITGVDLDKATFTNPNRDDFAQLNGAVAEGKITAAGLKYREGNRITTLLEINTGGTTVADRKQRIKLLKDYSQNAGGLTDEEYNHEIENYKPADDPIVKTYSELRDKTSNDEKYKPFKKRFDDESKQETETGVAADKDLTTATYLPEKIGDSESKDSAKPKKSNYKNLLTLRTKILARKKAVVDLIEGLVTGDTGGNGSKLTCPNCNQKFDALPFEYNGKKYHSQQCADEAKQKEGDQGGGGGGPDQNQGVAQARTAAIQAINEALNQDPKIATSDLDSNFQNWENQIEGLSAEKDINNLRDRVKANIAKKRKEKQTKEKMNKAGKDIDKATGPELINKIKELEKHEGTNPYEEQ
ncbi:5523_t:CDS:2 [Cetraspora pellucida]|uniref:5523_t:CDS:1 n=1 Tax=Cetraspora pellucida TaxID=1433469 RepID=A0ACA9LHZ3_9GLOM|nr:5523_t:CDS:2 [Cetraspora pellucida]